MGKTMQKWSQRVSRERIHPQKRMRYLEEVCRDGQYRVDIQHSGT